ncbi:hypothetical protein AAU57_03110 [Nonlabens sp. YIK11]|uniref:SIMPL domain-containing protein n=1 Tax=Nonlabens sp. YIK11 TaxID=1453349 RepID=UPI0006DBF58A|nr:SIMPL domain-containing protein [Nonlabens sp. YIK11]KQC32429.1 hypothetical protein AAU57_03110 [Nonlabens sp. YIK11]
MKYLLSLLLLSTTISLSAQSKNFIDQPYIETQATVDTLIVPDEIYISIVLDEDDNRNRKSTEELENTLQRVLKSLNIDTEKNLSLLDYSSDFKKYFLSDRKVLKTKMYSLIVADAVTAGKVLVGLEQEGISNVSIFKTSYSKENELLFDLKSKAILKAKQNAESMVKPLNQKVGKAIFISDASSVSSALQGKVSGIQIRGASSIYGSRASEPIMIDFEKIKFSSDVNVKFVIE